MHLKYLLSRICLISRGCLGSTDKSWIRISQYVAVRDGTRLAVDIFRPAKHGKPVVEPLPVIWTHQRYHRAFIEEYSVNPKEGLLKHLLAFARYLVKGNAIRTELDKTPWLKTLIQHGYVIAVVDVRGSGASYGTYTGPFSKEETNDAYDITEWFAEQPWCDRNVGMFGDSYMGITQYMAASVAPPALKAIFPQMALFDLYEFTYAGGIFRHDFVTQWSHRIQELDTSSSVAPVDRDRCRSLLAEAIQQHQANRNVFEFFQALPYRDSQDPEFGTVPYIALSPSSYLEQIKTSKVPIFHLAGWYDMWCRDAILWFKNLKNFQKLVIGPWSHSQRFGFDLATAHLHWYDYWLKGIDNGILESAPISYYTINAPKGEAWHSTWEWPLSEQNLTKYYFHGLRLGTNNFANDGLLITQSPQNIDGQDNYVVDYTTTSGRSTRWMNGYGSDFGYGDMAANDKKGLTYTTHPLIQDIQITGHPVIHLWITSTAHDANLFVYLEDVDHQGVSHYISEGNIKASHRAISTPSYNYIGLPYHRSFAADITKLTDQPTQLLFDLHPISYLVKAGNRIRVAITCADKHNVLTLELSPPPIVNLYRNINYASYVILPIIPCDT